MDDIEAEVADKAGSERIERSSRETTDMEEGVHT